MKYDTSYRSLNFVTDLVADKMDVIKRKAEMYSARGYTDAVTEMQRVWGLLKRAYDTAKTDIALVTRDDKGTPIAWAGSRPTQYAMDAADTAMTQYGQILRNDLRQERAAAEAAIADLNAQINALRLELTATQKSRTLDNAEKMRQINALQSSIEAANATITNLQNAKRMCDDQLSALRAESLDQKRNLEAQIKAHMDRIRELSSQIESAQNAHELGAAEQGKAIADLGREIEQSRSMIESLTRAKQVCDQELASLRAEASTQIAKLDAEIQGLRAQLTAAQSSQSTDSGTIAALQQEISDLQAAKAQCEAQVEELSEPIVLETQSMTGSDAILRLNNRNEIIKQLSDRDSVINELRKNISDNSEEIEDAKAAQKEAEARAANAQRYAFGLGVIAFVAVAHSVYKFQTSRK
jgi:chromosome segregation ATPase